VGNAPLPIHAHGSLVGSPHLPHQPTPLAGTVVEEKSSLQQVLEKWKAYKAKFQALKAMHPATPHPPAAQGYQNPSVQLSQNPPTQQTEPLPAPIVAQAPNPSQVYHFNQTLYLVSLQAFQQLQIQGQGANGQGDSAGPQPQQPPQLPLLPEFEPMFPDDAWPEEEEE
jgi:hypothetical protein